MKRFFFVLFGFLTACFGPRGDFAAIHRLYHLLIFDLPLPFVIENRPPFLAGWMMTLIVAQHVCISNGIYAKYKKG
jgi:hypothetical protein